ncbi:hypothetical protein [Streptomyces sp. NPDC102409]|uniref:hypothetical protein n=1 Tax=Streptomyces sp. NPDC102409 TaxID=3366172 RepID=UPI00381EECC5
MRSFRRHVGLNGGLDAVDIVGGHDAEVAGHGGGREAMREGGVLGLARTSHGNIESAKVLLPASRTSPWCVAGHRCDLWFRRREVSEVELADAITCSPGERPDRCRWRWPPAVRLRMRAIMLFADTR